MSLTSEQPYCMLFAVICYPHTTSAVTTELSSRPTRTVVLLKRRVFNHGELGAWHPDEVIFFIFLSFSPRKPHATWKRLPRTRIVIILQDYCTRMHRFFRQSPTMLAVIAFVCMLHATNAKNSKHCWANNVVTCCIRLHGPYDEKRNIWFSSSSMIISCCSESEWRVIYF